MRRKQSWESVLEEHADYMSSMVTVAFNQFQAYGLTEAGTPNNPQNDGKTLFLNLLDRDELTGIAAQAFRAAYKKWDGERPFKVLFRVAFLNLVRNAAKKERLHRYREPTMSMWDTDDGFNLLSELMDTRTYMIPVEQCDFQDFVDSLTGVNRTLVEAVLDAPSKLRVKGDAPPKAILGALKRYSERIAGLTMRQYWAACYEIGELLRERSSNVSYRSRQWHAQNAVRN